MTEEKITWDDALKNANFVTLETDKEKIVVVTNWGFERRALDAPVAKGMVEFKADCIEEDGESIEKQFAYTSKRLIEKLRPIFENRPSTDKIKISVLRIGNQFNTQYSVREITEEN